MPAHLPRIAAPAWNRYIEAVRNRHAVPMLALLHLLAALLVLESGLAMLHPAAALPDLGDMLGELHLAVSLGLFGEVPRACSGWQKCSGQYKACDPSR